MPDQLPDFGVEETNSSALPDFSVDLPDFGEPSHELSQVKLSPYQTIDRNGMKPPSGMESGTEVTTAVASDPVGFAKSIPSIVGGVMMAPGKLAYADRKSVV